MSYPPLVLLHGFTGTPHCFDRLVAALPAGPILTPAARGHDGSDPPPRPMRFVDEVSRLARLVASRCRQPVRVLGYSQGARLGLGLMVEHPELVHSVTLIGLHPGLRDDAARRVRRQSDEAWCRLLLGEGTRAFVDAWERQPLFLTQSRLDPSVLSEQRRRRLSHRPDGLAWALRSLGLAAMPDYWQSLAKVRVPVHLMAGRLDTKFVALARAAANDLGCALTLVEDTGHNIVLERPEAVVSALRRGVMT